MIRDADLWPYIIDSIHKKFIRNSLKHLNNDIAVIYQKVHLIIKQRILETKQTEHLNDSC